MSYLTNTNRVNELADARIAANVGSIIQGYNSKLQDISGLTLTGNQNKALVVNGAGTNLTLSSALGTAAYASTGVAAGNVPVLDLSGKLPISVLPPLAISEVYVVLDIAARNALTVQTGDTAIVTSINETYIWDGAVWQELLTSPAGVVSVNGLSGVVSVGLDTLTDVVVSVPSVGQSLRFNGSNFVNDVIQLTDTSGTLPVTRGGTGLTSLPLRSVMVANVANVLTTVTPTAVGHVLRFDGTNIGFTKVNYSELNGAPTIDYSRVQAVTIQTAPGNFTASNSHHVIIVNKAVGEATTINLPSGTANKMFIIKDGRGDANLNNITIDPNGVEQIDGATTYVLSVAYESVQLVWNGTQWNII